MAMKGFVLTLDALVALTVFFLAMLAGLLYLSQPESPRSIYLKQVSQDVLIIAEKQSLYASVLSGNGTAFRDLLRRVPANVCLQVAIQLNASNQTVVNDPSCTSYAGSLQTSWATIVHHNYTTYNVRLDSWYR